MSAEQWLVLTDYASKYRISVSTLRRRIKAHQIPHRFENGKYYILDASPTHPEMTSFGKETPIFPGLKTFAVEPAPLKLEAVPTQSENSHGSANDYSDFSWNEQLTTHPSPETESPDHSPNQMFSHGYPKTTQDAEEPLISTATKLLSELKKAYMNILHEKEDQIIQLKEEVSDLKTLVRVLEDDNDRMRRMLTPIAR